MLAPSETASGIRNFHHILFDQQSYLEYGSALELQWKAILNLSMEENSTLLMLPWGNEQTVTATPIKHPGFKGSRACCRDSRACAHASSPDPSKRDFCRIISTGVLTPSRDAILQEKYLHLLEKTHLILPSWSSGEWYLREGQLKPASFSSLGTVPELLSFSRRAIEC